MVQLPIAKRLEDHQQQILEAIDLSKDIDGLTSKQFGLYGFGYHDAL